MKTISLTCPISTHTGYGITSFNIFKAFPSVGYDPLIFPIGSASVESEESKTLIETSAKRAKTEFKKNDPCLKIWHQFDLSARVGSGTYGALVFFEIDKMNPVEVNMMNNVDITFVASGWAKNILESEGVTSKIVVSPLAVDSKVFYPSKTINLENPENPEKYVFMNIGKWEIRKGHDILVEAFNAAFTKEDNVELRMMNHNPFLTVEENGVWAQMYKDSKLGDKITILDRVGTHADVANIINQADCGIFPARAEGWNNEIPEFMACNKPVITTNYSAHTQYCNEGNAYLIDIDAKTQARDDHFFRNGVGEWADLGEKQVDQLVEHMRFVYKNNIRENPNGVQTAGELSWQNTAQILGDSLHA